MMHHGLHVQGGGAPKSGFQLRAVDISDSLRSDESLAAQVSRASAILASEIGSSANRVSAVWKLESDDRGRSLLTLNLTDSTGSVSATFAPYELEQEEHFRRRSLRVWGDLLQERSRLELEQLHRVVEQIGEQ